MQTYFLNCVHYSASTVSCDTKIQYTKVSLLKIIITKVSLLKLLKIHYFEMNYIKI